MTTPRLHVCGWLLAAVGAWGHLPLPVLDPQLAVAVSLTRLGGAQDDYGDSWHPRGADPWGNRYAEDRRSGGTAGGYAGPLKGGVNPRGNISFSTSTHYSFGPDGADDHGRGDDILIDQRFRERHRLDGVGVANLFAATLDLCLALGAALLAVHVARPAQPSAKWRRRDLLKALGVTLLAASIAAVFAAVVEHTGGPSLLLRSLSGVQRLLFVPIPASVFLTTVALLLGAVALVRPRTLETAPAEPPPLDAPATPAPPRTTATPPNSSAPPPTPTTPPPTPSSPDTSDAAATDTDRP